MELRAYGRRGLGFLVFWLSLVFVYVVCVGVSCCNVDVCFVFLHSVFGDLGLLGFWFPGFLYFCVCVCIL